MENKGDVLVIRIEPDGCVRGLYDDALVQDIPGEASVVRATLIEPTEGGGWGVWDARTGLVGDPLFRAKTRAACLEWERGWVNAVHLETETPLPPPF